MPQGSVESAPNPTYEYFHGNPTYQLAQGESAALSGAGSVAADGIILFTGGCRQKGERRVLRGGSWINNGRNVRSANRNRNDPGNRNANSGFRLARAQELTGRYA